MAHSSIGTPSPTILRSGLRLFVGKMVSGSISPGSPPYFSPFPHGTGSLLVRLTYLALADSSACFLQVRLFPKYSREITRSTKWFSPKGLLPSMVSLSRVFRLIKLCLNVLLRKHFCAPEMPPALSSYYPYLDLHQERFELLPFRSPLLRKWFRQVGTFFIFLRLLRCFTSAGLLLNLKLRHSDLSSE